VKRKNIDNPDSVHFAHPGFSLGALQTGTDNYRLTVKVADRNSNSLKAYEFEGACTVMDWYLVRPGCGGPDGRRFLGGI
jgi:hypothetical protein